MKTTLSIALFGMTVAGCGGDADGVKPAPEAPDTASHNNDASAGVDASARVDASAGVDGADAGSDATVAPQMDAASDAPGSGPPAVSAWTLLPGAFAGTGRTDLVAVSTLA